MGADARVETIKQELESGQISPEIAMQRLIALMREEASIAGAKELYQHASSQAYGVRRSSMAYSHPPPPADTEED